MKVIASSIAGTRGGTAVDLIRQISGPKYPAEGIERILKKYFGDALLRDALTNVEIPAYALEGPNTETLDTHALLNNTHVFLNNYSHMWGLVHMWEAARATSAAPTYFPPFRIPI